MRSVEGPPVDPSDYLTVEHATRIDEDFSGRRLKGFTSVASQFERCSFDGLRTSSASFGAGRRRSEYVECSFNGARIEAPAPGRARFTRCTFEEVHLRGWACFDIEFIDCTFSGRAEEMIFNGRSYGLLHGLMRGLSRGRRNRFEGNDFRRLDLRHVAFRTGVDLTKQCLPEGPDHRVILDAKTAVEQAESRIEAWPEDETRATALRVLAAVFTDDVAYGQEQLYIRESDWAHDELTARVVAALTDDA